MKNIFKFLAIIFLLITTLSCTNDEPDIIDPVVIPPKTIPLSERLKPAIRNISSSSITNKTTEVRKSVIKAYQFPYNRVNTNYQYKLYNMTIAEYIALPTDNLYNSKEDSLNVNTEVETLKDFIYNDAKQLIQIKTSYILHTEQIAPDENYSYDNTGRLEHVTIASYGTYTYNVNGLISAKLRTDGTFEFTYDYDEQGRIINSYHWSYSPTGIEKDFRYIYSYPDTNFYTKTWYSVNNLTTTETRVDKIIVQFDPTKPGIYNKEPIYQLENEHLHKIKVSKENNAGIIEWSIFPKYFYDSEGYLMKYDEAGLNHTSDIITFKY